MTGEVVMLKFAADCPAGTVIVAGTWEAESLELKVTTVPPAGAVPLRVTVPVELVPPVTELGEIVTKWIATEAPTMKPELTVLLFKVAEKFTHTFELDPEVVILNDFEVCPAGTVTLNGTCATALLEVSTTMAPPAGAGFVNVTVPVLADPPVTVLGKDEIVCMAIEEPMPKPQLAVTVL